MGDWAITMNNHADTDKERRRERRRRAKCRECIERERGILEIFGVSKPVAARLLDRADVATRYGLPKLLTAREHADLMGRRYGNGYYKTLYGALPQCVVRCGAAVRAVTPYYSCTHCANRENPIPTAPTLTLDEFAEWAGIRYNSAWRLANQGKIPGAVKVGRRWQVNPHKLLEQVGGNG